MTTDERQPTNDELELSSVVGRRQSSYTKV